MWTGVTIRGVPKPRSDASAEALQLLDDEFVPLSVATTITYFHVTDALRRVSTEEELADIAHLVAIALSTVAPLYREATPACARELEEMLFRPLRERADATVLEKFSIRRRDLRTAMTTLKEARVAFGRRR